MFGPGFRAQIQGFEELDLLLVLPPIEASSKSPLIGF